MKKFFTIIMIIPLLFFCGFKKSQKPYIMLSSGSVKVETDGKPRIERFFNARERIHYLIVAPDGFKYSGIRMQISKKDEKTSNWGFSIIQNEDLIVDMAQNTYRNYIYIQQPGYYILQFFYLNNKNYPFAHTEFVVQ